MPAPVHAVHSTPHPQLPASQTAPVAEFRCLYTPDIRKKQKKWHDGYLKFHAFNNRVMVYDQARNFLGDTYYKDSNELHEGDELTLDKGVMVEVADALGVTQTDLSPLFEKKTKEPPPPPTAPPRRFQPPSQLARPSIVPSKTTRPDPQLRHKSLNTLLGTPKGPIGKSVAIRSPYEARQEQEQEQEQVKEKEKEKAKAKAKEPDFVVDRAAKRRKTAHSSTSSATLRLSSPVQENNPAPKTTPRGPGSAISLDTLDAITHVAPNITLPSTPPVITNAPATVDVTPVPLERHQVIESSALRTPRIPKGKVPVPSVKALSTPKFTAPPSSPPVSASNRLSNIDFALQPTPAKEPVANPPRQSSPRPPKAKSLRLSSGVKRGTLMMCQPPSLLQAKQTNKHQIITSKSKAIQRSSTFEPGQSPSSGSRVADNALEKASAPKVKHKPALFDIRTGGQVDEELSPGNDGVYNLDNDQDVFQEVIGQQLVNSCASSRTSPSTLSAMRSLKRMSPVPETTGSPARAVHSPTPSSVKAPPIQSRTASPVLDCSHDTRSRTAPLSPQKLAALSTGGFRNKTKRVAPTLNDETSRIALSSHDETAPLAPHPLRASKNGPVMTTTELAATLRKPTKKVKPSPDPIEEEVVAVGKSPDRKFRRVRSANDAPIPSISEDWGKRNVPKTSVVATEPRADELANRRDTPAVVARKKSGLAALVKKTDPRRKLARTQSLNLDTTSLPVLDAESPELSPVVDHDVGPWSTEAFDLFDSRPANAADIVA